MARATLTTSTIRTCASAPAEARAAAGPSAAAWRSWRTTAVAPTASAVRRMAPTLCGSSTPSNTTISGRGSMATTCSSVQRRGASPSVASTPWCRSPRPTGPVPLRRRAAPAPPSPPPGARSRRRARRSGADPHLADAARPQRLPHRMHADDDDGRHASGSEHARRRRWPPAHGSRRWAPARGRAAHPRPHRWPARAGRVPDRCRLP